MDPNLEDVSSTVSIVQDVANIVADCAVDDAANSYTPALMESDRKAQPSTVNITGVSGGEVHHATVAGVMIADTVDTVKAGTVIIRQPRKQILKKKTELRLSEWTKDMIHTEATQTILDKISQGLRWITIFGNPGEGKTTASYLTLKHYHSLGKEVYDIQTLEEYEAVKDVEDCVIMLDDIFGQFQYNKSHLDKWNAVMNDILKLEEHREVSGGGRKCTVLMVSRSNVLKAATPHLGKYKRLVLRENCIVDLSLDSKRIVSEDHQRERMRVWQHHAGRNIKIEIDEHVVREVCRMKLSHGFPHCCKLFAEKFYHEGVGMKAFFEKPMQFLNDTLESFIDDKEIGPLLCQILKSDGDFNLDGIEDYEKRLEYKLAVRRLEGSYLSTEDDVVSFKHRSIYDSAAFVMCRIDPKFVIENCSLLFINERIRFEGFYSIEEDDSLIVYIKQKHIETFIKRLGNEISASNIQFSLAHESFHDPSFVPRFTPVVMPSARLKETIHLRDKTTKQTFLFLSSSSRSDKILIHICNQLPLTVEEQQDCVFGICEYSSPCSLRFFLRTFKNFNLNCRNSKSQTPLLVASSRTCDQMMKVLLAKDVDVRLTDEGGSSALHFVCENGIERDVEIIKKLIQKGADINLPRSGRPSLPLHIASFNGHLNVVEVLLECGADVKTKDGRGGTALHFACTGGHGCIVSALLDRGTDVDASDNYGSTPLQSACYWGHSDVVSILLRRGADVNRIGRGGRMPIYDACQRGHVLIVSCLIDRGADINQQNKTGSTPLQEACYEGHFDVVDFLLERKADLNTKDQDGRTPLHVACYRRKLKTVECLMERGADLNVTDNSGKTPLHYVCFEGQESILSLLIEKGSDVNKPCNEGMTGLHYASYHGHINVVKLLLEKGADVNATTQFGISVLHYGCQSDNDELVSLLLGQHADINKADDNGRTPFHEACRAGNFKIVRLLLQKYSDINKADKNGNTPLHDACGAGHYKIANLLLKNGADVNKEDKTGRTSLHYACYFGHGEVISILLTFDVDVIRKDSSGNTPLHFACENGGIQLDVIQALFYRVDETDVRRYLNTVNVDGNTPLHMLSGSQNPCTPLEDRQKLGKFLIQRGADPNILNNEGKLSHHGSYRDACLETT